MAAVDTDGPVRPAWGTVVLFLVVAFALDWVSWILAGAQSGWAIDESNGMWGPLLAASMFGPSLPPPLFAWRERQTSMRAGDLA